MNTQIFKVIILFTLMFVPNSTIAQLTDIARLEYSFIPQSQSEDQYTRFRALFNYPIELKKGSYFVIGAEYNRVHLKLEEPYPFETDIIDKFHIIDFSMAYTFKTHDDWRFGVKVYPRIASTLTQSITWRDFFINGGIYAIKDRLKDESLNNPWRLILGLTYNSTAGVPFPLPFISYYRILNEKWSYTLGIPKSNIKLQLNSKSTFQTFVTFDGFYAHIQDAIVINDELADHISLSVVVGGLGYEYSFTDHLAAYIYTGYTFRLNNVLRAENRDEIYKLDNINAPYLRTGLKFKI
ncbi:DUF6268 family outer membrane beta-barrel protein [Hanstruepera flava]|uniref:DUF6268 family outer membrane beta-barrel protein n=1 Tax=Hanstruepera flava TaxID=2930218 RepID=UPI002027C180|nr:DUF6268 family outer membrane beta-barrel protein [Hanstruepera flava]